MRILGSKRSRQRSTWCARRSWDELRQSRWGDGLWYAQAAIKSDPTYAEGYRMAAHAWLGAGDTAEARRLLESGVQAAGPDAGLCFALGDLDLRRHAYDEAEGWFLRGLEIRQGDVAATIRLAVSQSGQGRGADAADAIRNAVSATPERYDLSRLVGSAHVEGGDWDQAVVELKRNIAEHGSSGGTCYALAVALIRLTRLEEALAAARDAVAVAPLEEEYRNLFAAIVLVAAPSPGEP